MLDPTKTFQSLKNQLDKAEVERKQRFDQVKPFKAFFWVCMAGSLYVLGYAVYYLTYGMEIFGLLAGSFLLGVIVYGIKNAAEEKKYKQYFQKEVAPELIALLGPDFTYQPNGYLSKERIIKSAFFRSFNKYQCEDLVMGTVGGRSLSFGEIELIKEKVKGSVGQRGGTRKERKKIFKGLFLSLDLGSGLPGAVWILPARRWISAHYPELDQDSTQNVETDHPALKKDYLVYAEDPEFAQKLLQTTVVDQLMKFNKRLIQSKITKGNSYFLFRQNRMDVALPLRRRFMEPRLDQPVNTMEFVELLLLPLNGIYEVGEILK